MADGIIDLKVNEGLLARSIDSGFAKSNSLRKPYELKLNGKNFSQPLGRIRADLGEFNKSLDAASARVLAFGASVGIINAVRNSIVALVRDTAAVEEALTKINVVLNANSKELQVFGQRLFEVAKNTQQSFSAAAEAATEFSRQGLSLEQTLRRTNDALILTRISGLGATKSVETLTAAINGFSNVALNSTKIINTLAAVDAAFAVSSADLADALSRAGSSAQDANVQFNELLALTTSVQQQTARGGAVIGNAFKTIFARISRGTSIDQLRDLGVAIDETQSGVEKLRAIGKALQSADEITGQKIQEIAGGVRQINIISAAFRDLNREVSLYGSALQVANTATDEATSRNDRLNKSLSAIANQAGLSIKEFNAELGKIGVSDNLKTLLSEFDSFVSGINGFLQGDGIGNSIGKSIISGIGDFITGPGLVIAGKLFLKLFGQIAKDTIGAFKSIAGINKEFERQANLQKVISTILTSQDKQYQTLLARATTKAEKEQVVLNILNQQVAAQQRLQTISSQLAGSSVFKNFGVSTSGGIIKNGASGIVPGDDGLIGAFRKEKKAIEKGVGGASSGAKPVLIQKFKFGNGRIGPIVANSDEYVVENFNDTGSSAILTKEMVEQLGGKKFIKEVGARKVPNAASGANFNRDEVRGKGGKFLEDKVLNKINKATNSYVEALTKGTKEAQEKALKALNKLSKEITERSKNTVKGFAAKQSREFYGKELTKQQEATNKANSGKTIGLATLPTRVTDDITDTVKKTLGQIEKKAILENFANGRLPQPQNEELIRTQFKKERLSDLGFSTKDSNKILAAENRLIEKGEALSGAVERVVKDINAVAKIRLDDQKKVIKTQLVAERDARREARLQEFDNASKTGGLKRLVTTGTTIPGAEFARLTPSQRRDVVQQRSLSGRLGRVGQSSLSALKNPFGLSFAASLAAPLLDQASASARERGSNGSALGLSGLSGAATGASFGAILGPYGAGVGAVAGALLGLVNASDDAAGNVQRLTKSLEDQQAESTKTANSLQQVLTFQERVSSLISTNASASQINAAQSELTSSISGISNKGLRNEVSSILTDPKNDLKGGLGKISEILAQQQREAAVNSRLLESVLKVNELEKKNRSFANVGGIFGDSNLSGEDISSVARNFSAAIAGLDGDKVDQIRKTLNTLNTTSSNEDVTNFFKQIGLSGENAKALSQGLGSDFDLIEFLNALKEELSDQKDLIKFIDLQKSYKISLSESNRELEKIASNINLAGSLADISRNSAANKSRNNFDLKFSTANFADPFVKGLVDFQRANQDLAFEAQASRESLSRSLREGLLSITGGEGTPTALRDLLIPLARSKDLAATPNLVNGLLSSIDQLKNSGSTQFDEAKGILNSMLVSIRESESLLLDQKDTAIKNLEIARLQAREEQRVKNTSFAGGIESLLNGPQDRLRTFSNRGALLDSSSQLGAFSQGPLREAAKGIIEAQSIFKGVGVDLRDFAPEVQSIVENAVRGSISDFASLIPGANVDISQITKDIVDNFFQDDLLTADSLDRVTTKTNDALVSKLGALPVFFATETNTRETADEIKRYLTKVENNVRKSQFSDKINSTESNQLSLIGKRNTLASKNIGITRNRGELLSQALVNRNLTKDDFLRIDPSDEKLAFQAATQFNEAKKASIYSNSTGKSIQEVFSSTSKGPLEEFIQKNNLRGSSGAANFSESLFKQGVISVDEKALSKLSQDYDKNSEEINSLNASIQKLAEEIKSLNKEKNRNPNLIGDFLSKALSGSNKLLDSAKSSVSQLFSSIPASPTQEEVARKKLASQSLAGSNTRGNAIFGDSTLLAGGDPAKAQQINSILRQFETNIGALSIATKEVASQGLAELDLQLEQLGADLDSLDIPELNRAFGSLVNERFRSAGDAGRSAGKSILSIKDNPFATKSDLNSEVSSALKSIQVIENSSLTDPEKISLIAEYRSELEKIANVGDAIPTDFLSKVTFGIQSSTDRIKDSLLSVSEIAADVTTKLTDGFADAFLSAIDGSQDLGTSLRSLFSSVLKDLARVQAQQAFAGITAGLGSAIGGLFSKNSGGKIPSFARGGVVPTLLTGGEFSAGPELVNRYGLSTFEKMNKKLIPTGNYGYSSTGNSGINSSSTGYVNGGSGVKDDVYQMLHPGSFVLNKAATKKYSHLIKTMQNGGQISLQKPQGAFFGSLIKGIGKFFGAGAGVASGAASGAVGGAVATGVAGQVASEAVKKKFSETIVGRLLTSSATAGLSTLLAPSSEGGSSKSPFEAGFIKDIGPNGYLYYNGSEKESKSQGKYYSDSAQRFNAGGTVKTVSSNSSDGDLAQLGINVNFTVQGGESGNNQERMLKEIIPSLKGPMEKLIERHLSNGGMIHSAIKQKT